MKKKMILAVLASMCLAACGGGGDAPVKTLAISMYGKPVVSATPSKVARFSLISSAMAADTATGTSDVQATIQSLTDALAARGVTANVTPQVMDGTTLHQIVTTQYNGTSPTQDQFKVDPSEFVIINFQLDDMVTTWDDPAQQAATKQFSADLLVFSQWAAVNGRSIFVLMPIQTCDMRDSAAAGLTAAIYAAFSNGAPIRFVGGNELAIIFDTNGVAHPTDGEDLSHLGADCRSPDAYLQNQQVIAIADMVALLYKDAEASAASAASGT